PGCSAVGEAAFSQHGPFLVTSKGLIKNPNSWNREANMLYLDSPAGVGFSYSENMSDYLFLNDAFAARDHLAFLQLWFSKYSDFRTNDFFIAGESYAGHFAPQLAHLILQTKSEFNLKGIAHGVISESTYEMLNNECSYPTIKKQIRATGELSTSCAKVNLQMETEINANTDTFDILADVCPVPPETRAGVKTNVCIRDDSIAYLNRKDVRKALHAKLVGVKAWSSCSPVLVYDFQNLENPTISLLGTLVKSGVRVLAYSGDQDSVIPFIGTRSLINGLAKDLGLNVTRHHQVWFHGTQVAGWTQVYGDILTFATVRGAGPGCSAVGEAAFSQHGPFLVTSKGLIKNPNSWNTEANMLYLDSPAGVGFSYSENMSDYLFLNDAFAARDHLAFLQLWFSKFSDFRTNDFFIAGESYAGHFAPQLAHLILQTKSEFNLKGIAHGVISESTYEMLNNECSYPTIKKQIRATGELSTSCAKVNLQMETEINANTDTFDILADVCPVPPETRAGVKTNVCIRDDSIAYLNRKDVRKALHAKLVGVKAWSSCSPVLVYDFQNLENSTISLLGTLVKSGVRVLAYSGDQDSVIPFIGTRSLINGLAKDLVLKVTRHHQAWFHGTQVNIFLT
ncbi:hypothetical protein RYX36_037175, partial [Vicia faba]